MAIYRRRPRAWVIGLGFGFFVLATFGFYAVVVLAPAFARTADLRLTVSIGLLGLLISISIYLAMGVAQTERDLEARLVEVQSLHRKTLEQEREAQRIETERRLLEAENRRQADELEAARQLQLSMLPSKRPELAHLDVAFRMWTATEVGGDYYDYYLDGDGRLTLAVGDATGHGLDAGQLVVAAKSVFQAMDGGGDVAELLERISRAIRRLNLKRMNMAMTLVRVEGHVLSIATAGMPPALVYRAAAGSVEEVVLPGPPLGSLKGLRYRELEIALEPGDAMLLTTDGLPEMIGPDGEPLGYERAQALYAEVAGEAPETVLETLHVATREFAAGRPLEDDLTLVALRFHPHAGSYERAPE